MRNWILTAVAALALSSISCQRSTAPSSVAARVNGKDIPMSEVEGYFKVRSEQLDPKPEGDQANLLKLDILRDLIEAEMMDQKAAELKIQPSAAEVDAEIKNLKGNTTDAEFQKTLAEKGVAEADLRKEITRSLTQAKVMDSQVRAQVKVTDAEISSFYQQNKEAFDIKEPMYRIAVIAVSSDPSAPENNAQNDKAMGEEQALEKIQMLEVRARAGEDFQELARQYSEDPQTAQAGGDMGYQTAAMLERFGPQFRDTIMKMKPGDMTPVIRAEGSYFLFRLLSTRSPGQGNLNNPEVRQTIHDQLQNQKQQLLTAAFNEQLHDQAHVENFLAQQVVASFRQGK